MDNVFNDRIKPLFDSSGMTDKDIEDALNLPRGIIYKWKTGKNKNWKTYFIEISEFFHVSTAYLLGQTDDPTPIEIKKDHPALGEDWVDEDLSTLSDEELERAINRYMQEWSHRRNKK